MILYFITLPARCLIYAMIIDAAADIFAEDIDAAKIFDIFLHFA